MPERLKIALERAAKKAGRPQGEIIREALATYLGDPSLAEMRPAHRPPKE